MLGYIVVGAIVVIILIGCLPGCSSCSGGCPVCNSYNYKKDKHWPNGNVRKWCMNCGHKWWA